LPVIALAHADIAGPGIEVVIEAFVSEAHLHADVQEGTHLPRAVTCHQDRVFAYVSGEEIARLRDLAFVAQKQLTRAKIRPSSCA